MYDSIGLYLSSRYTVCSVFITGFMVIKFIVLISSIAIPTLITFFISNGINIILSEILLWVNNTIQISYTIFGIDSIIFKLRSAVENYKSLDSERDTDELYSCKNRIYDIDKTLPNIVSHFFIKDVRFTGVEDYHASYALNKIIS